MKKIVKSTAFKKDYKRILKRQYPEQAIIKIIELLINDEPFPDNCRVHKLSGEYSNFWECHIAPDWLLIYEYNHDELVLRRTGTHADLFR